MHKKILAMLTIAIFIIGTLAVMTPASAHFTLGDYTSTYPYHANDLKHVDGLIGYAWPGGGLGSYVGPANGFPLTNLVGPGYMPPYISAADQALLQAPQNWLQLTGHAYAPFGAVLTGSTGDLIFAINATCAFTSTDPTCGKGINDIGYSSWSILIPPEFSGIVPEQVVTTVTDNTAGILVYHLNQYDRWAPGWTLVKVIADGMSNKYNGLYHKNVMNFTTAGKQWYYVRVNGVTAPTVAGKYFFKMFLTKSKPNPKGDTWVPAENWPVLLVKGEIDPAVIDGNLFYGGYNQTLYGTSIQLPGQVWAKMTTKLDPYTGAKLSGGLTDAVGYFNASAKGHY